MTVAIRPHPVPRPRVRVQAKEGLHFAFQQAFLEIEKALLISTRE